MQDIDFKGYVIKANVDSIDDVKTLDTIRAIQRDKDISEVLPFLKRIIGEDGYNAMEQHFVEIEGKFKLTYLMEIFEVIMSKFDPKGSGSITS